MNVLRAIKIFQVVIDKGSFSKAAAHLGIVVSAVSRHVSELEEHFGCQLLYRTTRAMNLTAEGEYYLEQFNEVVQRIDSLEQRADLNQQDIAGHVRMSAPPNAEQLGITRLISEFVRQNPSVNITLTLLNRYVNLTEEGIDLAVRVHNPSDSRLVARRFTELEVLYVASPDYLARQGTPEHPKKLSEHNCVIDSSNYSPNRWRYFERDVERHVHVSGCVEVNCGNIAADFAAAGHGVAFLPDFLVQHYLDSGELVTVLEPFQGACTPVSLVYPVNRLNRPVLSELVQYFIDNAP